MNSKQVKLALGIMSGRINMLDKTDLGLLGMEDAIYAELDRGVSTGREKWNVQVDKKSRPIEDWEVFNRVEEIIFAAISDGVSLKSEEEVRKDIEDFFAMGK